MSISSISSSAAASIPDWQSVTRQRKQDFQDLASALQSGDLSGAKTAFADLQSSIGASSTTPGSNSTSGVSALLGSNPIQTDFSALGNALNSGNLTDAQSDFSKLQADFSAALSQNSGAGGTQGKHHHHHHHVTAAYQDPANGSKVTPATGNVSVVA